MQYHQQQTWQNLPPEILRRVFSHLSLDAKECQLTCRHWSHEAQKRLYHSVTIESAAQATFFTRTLISSVNDNTAALKDNGRQQQEYEHSDYCDSNSIDDLYLPKKKARKNNRYMNFAEAQLQRRRLREQKVQDQNARNMLGKYVRHLRLKRIFSPHLKHWDPYDILSKLVVHCPYVEEIDLLDKPFRNFWVKLMSMRYEGYWQCLKQVPYPCRENEIEFYLMAMIACRHTIEDILLCDQLTNRARGDGDHVYEKEYYQVANRIAEFNCLKTLTIRRHTQDNIMAFDTLIDACPMLTDLSITLYSSQSKQPVVSLKQYPDLKRFRERLQVCYLEVETILSQDVLFYIMKKFPLLESLQINKNCDPANVRWMRKLHMNYSIDFLDQLMEYLRSISSYSMDHVYIRNIEDMLCRCHIGKEHTLEIRYDHDTKRHDEGEDSDQESRHRFRLVKAEEDGNSLATVFYPACHIDLPHIKIIDKCGKHLELLTLDMRHWSEYNYTRIQNLLAEQQSVTSDTSSETVSTLPPLEHHYLGNNGHDEGEEENGDQPQRQITQSIVSMDQIMYNYHLDRLFRACTSLKRLNLIGLFLLDFDPYIGINHSIEHLSLHLCRIHIPIFYQLSVRLPCLKSLVINGWYFVEPDGKTRIQTHHNFLIDMPYTSFEHISWLGGSATANVAATNNDIGNEFSIPGSNSSSGSSVNTQYSTTNYFYLRVSTLSVEKYLKLDNHVIQLGSPEGFRRCLQDDHTLTFHIRCKSLKKFTIKYYQFKRSYLV